MDLGYKSKLRQVRLKKGLTQKQLAELAGVSMMTISRLETTTSFKRLRLYLQVVKALDVPVEEVFEVDPRPTNDTRRPSPEAPHRQETNS